MTDYERMKIVTRKSTLLEARNLPVLEKEKKVVAEWVQKIQEKGQKQISLAHYFDLSFNGPKRENAQVNPTLRFVWRGNVVGYAHYDLYGNPTALPRRVAAPICTVKEALELQIVLEKTYRDHVSEGRTSQEAETLAIKGVLGFIPRTRTIEDKAAPVETGGLTAVMTGEIRNMQSLEKITDSDNSWLREIKSELLKRLETAESIEEVEKIAKLGQSLGL